LVRKRVNAMDDRPLKDLTIRLLTPSDDVVALTALLHRAYGALAARGMRFLASYQTAEFTAKRIARGECAVAEIDGKVVGTVIFRPTGSGRGTPWYLRPDVATVGQFAVEPAWQGRGIGGRLMDWAEGRARATGAAEVALDTAETAEDLIRFYTRRGYRFVEHVNWGDVVNYRSVVMSKTI
jgi:GNAT superfamily N-acetyltransferase